MLLCLLSGELGDPLQGLVNFLEAYKERKATASDHGLSRIIPHFLEDQSQVS